MEEAAIADPDMDDAATSAGILRGAAAESDLHDPIFAVALLRRQAR
jgi:hypothetical protein